MSCSTPRRVLETQDFPSRGFPLTDNVDSVDGSPPLSRGLRRSPSSRTPSPAYSRSVSDPRATMDRRATSPSSVKTEMDMRTTSPSSVKTEMDRRASLDEVMSASEMRRTATEMTRSTPDMRRTPSDSYLDVPLDARTSSSYIMRTPPPASALNTRARMAMFHSHVEGLSEHFPSSTSPGSPEKEEGRCYVSPLASSSSFRSPGSEGKLAEKPPAASPERNGKLSEDASMERSPSSGKLQYEGEGLSVHCLFLKAENASKLASKQSSYFFFNRFFFLFSLSISVVKLVGLSLSCCCPYCSVAFFFCDIDIYVWLNYNAYYSW